MRPEQLDERCVEPDAVHVAADERCGNEEERNQVFGERLPCFTWWKWPLMMNHLKMTWMKPNAAVVAQADALDRRADDADIRRVAVEQDKDAAVAYIRQLDRCQNAPMTDRMYWYYGGAMRGS